MKTIGRLTVLILVIGLITIGLYAFFQSSAVQNWIGLVANGGRGRWAERAGDNPLSLKSDQDSWDGNGQGRGFGAGRREGGAFGRSEGWRGNPASIGDNFGTTIGWLSLIGNLLRLAILMAVVIGMVKIGRWIGKKLKSAPQSKNSEGQPELL